MKTKNPQQELEEIFQGLQSNPWGVLLKPTFWLICGSLACHMYMISESIWGRSLLCLGFGCGTAFMRGCGYSFNKSMLSLDYVLSAYYVPREIEELYSGPVRLLVVGIALFSLYVSGDHGLRLVCSRHDWR